MQWLYLSIAIVAEVIATSALKATQGFTQLGPSCIAVVGYVIAFYFLSLSLRTLPIGIAYAIWCGVGILLLTLIGWIVFKQRVDSAAIIGISFIMLGIIILNVFSKAVPH